MSCKIPYPHDFEDTPCKMCHPENELNKEWLKGNIVNPLESECWCKLGCSINPCSCPCHLPKESKEKPFNNIIQANSANYMGTQEELDNLPTPFTASKPSWEERFDKKFIPENVKLYGNEIDIEKLGVPMIIGDIKNFIQFQIKQAEERGYNNGLADGRKPYEPNCEC